MSSVSVKFTKQGVTKFGSANCGQPGAGSDHARREDQERKPVPHLWGRVWGHSPGFSIRIEVGGRIVEVGGKGVTRATDAAS